MHRTQSCYSNVLHEKDLQDVIKSSAFVHSNAGTTGYPSVPNKSHKILRNKAREPSKILDKIEPLYLKTKPMRDLSGCIYSEMVNLDKQRNKNKHFYQT